MGHRRFLIRISLFYPKLMSDSKIRAIFGEYNWFVRPIDTILFIRKFLLRTYTSDSK
ncbi:hypothetical protein LEP1GSC178_3529 [Leptospira licerasiae str. MMD4847]|uniref:DUF1564 family protein n=1 Tax=Leptospira licerasiae str. MMD4847 TaxID=1049971 RepID=A0ABN0HA96_9LEPT|nr:hypothetical protein LEP1GSC178_3529 [Leptospira licerasiae str. MMD4847]